MVLKSKIRFFLFVLVVFVAGLFALASCLKSKRPGIPAEVIEVFNISGVHKPELARFVLETELKDDSLKLDAAYFLLSNLATNYTAFYTLQDSSGAEYEIIPNNFKDYAEIKSYLDSIENLNGKLFYRADSFLIDYSEVSTQYLSSTVDKAFRVWRKNLDKRDYGFGLFKNYILPYRVANEEIEPFRDLLSEKFSSIIDDKKTFRENVEFINEKINSLVVYDETFVKEQRVPHLKKLLERGRGNLLEINILKVKMMRSLGFAAALDYSPFVVDSSGWYAWTTVITPKGEEIVMDISSGLLENLLEKRRIAKVYRKTFFSDPNSLYAIKKQFEDTPYFLGHFNNVDVSKSFIDVKNISVETNSVGDYLYLAVFNDGELRPVDWALIENGVAEFEDMGVAISYVPVLWQNGKVKEVFVAKY